MRARIGKKNDITGLMSGKLTALRIDESSPNGGAQWLCRCECGVEKVVSANNLVRGRAKSCGCASNEMRSRKQIKHGQSRVKSGAYSSWHAMKQRTQNGKTKQFIDYGGRGIGVCERWNSFANFYADMGDRPEGMSLDRIDVNKDYSLENCRWATRKQQSANQRPKISNGTLLKLLNAVEAVLKADKSNVDQAVSSLMVEYNAILDGGGK